MRSRLVPSTMAALSLAVLAGCGEDSAADRVCDDREDLRDAVQEVQDDVTAGNFGDARNDLEDVTTSFNQLRDAVTDLADEQDEALQPAIDSLSADVSALTGATSLEDLGARISTLLTDAQAVYDEVSTTLQCD